MRFYIDIHVFDEAKDHPLLRRIFVDPLVVIEHKEESLFLMREEDIEESLNKVGLGLKKISFIYLDDIHWTPYTSGLNVFESENFELVQIDTFEYSLKLCIKVRDDTRRKVIEDVQRLPIKKGNQFKEFCLVFTSMFLFTCVMVVLFGDLP